MLVPLDFLKHLIREFTRVAVKVDVMCAIGMFNPMTLVRIIPAVQALVHSVDPIKMTVNMLAFQFLLKNNDMTIEEASY